MNHAPFRRLNVLVMHDDPLLCAGVTSTLKQHAAFDVLGDGGEAFPCVDVVIADYDHAMRLASAGFRTPSSPLDSARILTLTSNDREADIREAIEAGIHGYVLLGGPLSELVEGVTTVANGMRYLCHSVARRMADSLSRESLTSREVEVLRLVVAGASNKAIAKQLYISVGTVKSHMSAIMTKLGATCRTQAAGIAASRGLVAHYSHARSKPPPHHARLRVQGAQAVARSC